MKVATNVDFKKFFQQKTNRHCVERLRQVKIDDVHHITSVDGRQPLMKTGKEESFAASTREEAKLIRRD